jgi:hypothetical protein
MKLTWRELNRIINSKSEDELRDMIIQESETFKRKVVLTRLHQKFTVVRAAREREELLGVKDKSKLM